MSFNGAGAFVRTDGVRSGSDVHAQQKTAGVNVRADLTDTELEDMATGMELAVLRDGQNAASANLPMGGFKHTGVTAASGGSSRTEYTSGGTVQDGAIWDAGDTGGTTTAFTATLSPAITAYANKQLFRVKFNAAFGATPTINFNAVAAKKMYWITKAGSVTQLTTNDVPSGYPGLLRYDTNLDSSAGGFMLLNPPAALIASAANTWSAAQTFSAAIGMSGAAINEAQGSDIASASTIDLDAATGNLVDVTGTTTITAVTLSQGRQRVVRFTGALTFTHGSSLVLPGAANITTAAGDFAILCGYASSVVRCVGYFKADGTPLVSSAAGRLLNVQFLKSGTSYTRTAGCTNAYVVARGGGGAGGGSPASAGAAGGGGGQGGLVRAWVTPAATETYAIGSGGAGSSGANGGAGGSTTWAGTITAGGGGGGLVGASYARGNGGTGGTATGGDLNIPGAVGVGPSDNGGSAYSPPTDSPASFGGGPGAGEGAGRGAASSANAAGSAATANTGGGGGGGASNGAAQAGGAGGSGYIIVYEYS